MFRLSIKMEHGVYKGQRDTYGFHLPRWRVIKSWPVNPRVTAPVTVRRHAKGAYVSNRLLLLSTAHVEPGAIVEPLSILQAYLDARRAA